MDTPKFGSREHLRRLPKVEQDQDEHEVNPVLHKLGTPDEPKVSSGWRPRPKLVAVIKP